MTSQLKWQREVTGSLEIAAGEFIGDFQILKKLTEGGLSCIHLCDCNGVPWVLKSLRMDPLWSAEELASCSAYFANECVVHPTLHHSFIAESLPAFRVEEELFLPIRYYPAGSLKGWVQSPEQTEISQAVRIVSQVAHALKYTNERGLLHRDVAPSNLLVDENGNAKLADFGFVRSLATPNAPSVRMSYGLGRWAYAAPELYDGIDEQYDHRVDIYSLGVVAIILLTKRPPRRAVPSKYRPDLSISLSNLFWAMVDDFPQNRPSWDEVIEELDAFLS